MLVFLRPCVCAYLRSGLSYFTLNLGHARLSPFTRVTSNSTLSDVTTGAAAVPGSSALTVSRPASPASHVQEQQPPQQQHQPAGKERTRFAKAAVDAAVQDDAPGTRSRSASPSKGPAHMAAANAMARAKSSPFEAGPPDWTPFADPATPLPPTVSGELAAAAATASSASTASAAASSSSGGSSAVFGTSISSAAASHRTAASNASSVLGPLAPGLSTHTSVLLRGAANPLQGALSNAGLGSADTPVLFLHGVGGLPAYLEMILHVMGLGHPVIVVEFKGVSMRLG